jgi:hypothetical protein
LYKQIEDLDARMAAKSQLVKSSVNTADLQIDDVPRVFRAQTSITTNSDHFIAYDPNIKKASSYECASEEMTLRWKQQIERSLPAIDLIDLAAENNVFRAVKRQFAPEFS